MSESKRRLDRIFSDAQREIDRIFDESQAEIARRARKALIVTGALSDRWGRKNLITGGMLTQAAALVWIATAEGFAGWLAGAALLGAGT